MYSVVLISYSAFDLADALDAGWKDTDCKVIKTAVCTKEEIVEVKKINPDMVFICTNDDSIDFIEITENLIEEMPDIVVGLFSSIRDFEFVKNALNAGIAGFVSLPCERKMFKAALKTMKRRCEEKKKASVYTGAGKVNDPEEVSSFVVRNALVYIGENYRKKISLADVAEEIFVSKWYLSKILNQYLGKTFTDVINGYRIEEAKRLLLEPSMRIGEIAEQVGFSDSAHFSHVFKKMVGMSANEYRNKK